MDAAATPSVVMASPSRLCSERSIDLRESEEAGRRYKKRASGEPTLSQVLETERSIGQTPAMLDENFSGARVYVDLELEASFAKNSVGRSLFDFRTLSVGNIGDSFRLEMKIPLFKVGKRSVETAEAFGNVGSVESDCRFSSVVEIAPVIIAERITSKGVPLPDCYIGKFVAVFERNTSSEGWSCAGDLGWKVTSFVRIEDVQKLGNSFASGLARGQFVRDAFYWTDVVAKQSIDSRFSKELAHHLELAEKAIADLVAFDHAESYESNLLRGRLERRAAKFSEAEVQSRNALELATTEEQKDAVREDFAQLFERTGNLELAHFIASMGPKYILRVAQAHEVRREWKEAIAGYTHSMDAGVTDGEPLLHRGFCALQSGEKQAALDDFVQRRKASTEFPDKLALWTGRCLMDLGKIDEAIAEWKSVENGGHHETPATTQERLALIADALRNRTVLMRMRR